MPYNEKQNALFRAAAHNPAVAKSSGIPRKTARVLAGKGVKKRKRNRLSEMAYGS